MMGTPGSGPAMTLRYVHETNSIELDDPPLPASTTWTQPDLHSHSRSVLHESYKHNIGHAHRFIYALVGRVFVVGAPRPIGGRGNLGSGHIAVAPPLTGRGRKRQPAGEILRYVVGEMNFVLALNKRGSGSNGTLTAKDEMDNLVLRGMAQSGHLQHSGRTLLPEHMRVSLDNSHSFQNDSVSSRSQSRSVTPAISSEIRSFSENKSLSMDSLPSSIIDRRYSTSSADTHTSASRIPMTRGEPTPSASTPMDTDKESPTQPPSSHLPEPSSSQPNFGNAPSGRLLDLLSTAALTITPSAASPSKSHSSTRMSSRADESKDLGVEVSASKDNGVVNAPSRRGPTNAEILLQQGEDDDVEDGLREGGDVPPAKRIRHDRDS
ncbi:hypothetical protein BC829DRAFT_490479 [Chytridium lagenaria]|nr:hypothetical protein BC829DRAFT_490479 [Chytridium lagenaria]